MMEYSSPAGENAGEERILELTSFFFFFFLLLATDSQTPKKRLIAT